MSNLEALAIAAEAIDNDTAATEPGAIAAHQVEAQQLEQQGENVRQIHMMLDLAVPLLGAMYPSLPPIYTDQKRREIAASLGPVFTKYNIDLAKWGTAYKEEIGALMICGPVAWATVQGIKADIARREQTIAPGQVPLQKNVEQLQESVILG